MNVKDSLPPLLRLPRMLLPLYPVPPCLLASPAPAGRDDDAAAAAAASGHGLQAVKDVGGGKRREEVRGHVAVPGQ